MLTRSKQDLKRLIEESAILECPFQPTVHRVPAEHFERHVADCARRSLHLGLVTCRYNRWHVMSKVEKSAHEESCPDRNNVGEDDLQQAKKDLLSEVMGRIK